MSEPSSYALSNFQQRQDTLDLLQEYREVVKTMSGKCMDIGCGPGDITKDILLPALNSTALIIGTDISENMVKYASETYKDSERLKFEVLDIQTNDLPKKFISGLDHLFSFYALHWCGNFKQALENMYKMLRPNGTICFTLVSRGLCTGILEKIMRTAPYSSHMENIKKYISPFQHSIEPENEMKTMLNDIGFRVIHCSARPKNLVFKSVHHCITMMMSMTILVEGMPEELKKQYSNDFLHELNKVMEDKGNNPETALIDKCYLLVVYGQK